MATWNFFVNFLALNEDKHELLKAFSKLDKDGNGILTKSELVEGFLEVGIPDAEKEADRMFEECDLNKTGDIDYNGKTIIKILN